MTDNHVGIPFFNVHERLVDVNRAGAVQIQISEDGKRVWVNVDGVCVFRAYNTEYVEVDWQGRFQVSQGDPPV